MIPFLLPRDSMPRFQRWLILFAIAWMIPGGPWVLAQDPDDATPLLMPYPDNTPTSLPDLLREYKDLGLPLPFKGARLIYLDRPVFFANQLGLGSTHTSEHFCFEAKRLPGEKKQKLLLGLETVEADELFVVFREPPDKKTLDRLLLFDFQQDQPAQWAPWNRHELILAIQCYAEGHHEVAQFFLDRCRIHTQIPLRQRLLTIGWDHLMKEFANPKADRALLLVSIKKKIAKYKEWDTPDARELVADLERTLKPFPKRHSQAEEWIDQLTNYHSDPEGPGYKSPLFYLGTFQGRKTQRPDDAESSERLILKLLDMGLDCVPVLLSHLEDQRLTRTLNPNFGQEDQEKLTKDPVLRIGTICQILLDNLSSHPSMPQEGVEKNLAFYLSWWMEVCKEGEEAYLLKNCLQTNPNGPSVLFDPYLHLLNRKYPHQIPVIYKKVLAANPLLPSGLITKLIARGQLPKGEKIQVLNQGLKNPIRAHQFAALGEMESLDKARFALEWTKLAEAFLAKDYKWDDPEKAEDLTTIANLLDSSDDPKLWSILEKAVQAAPTELRGLLLSGSFMTNFLIKPDLKNSHLVIRFLLAFLDDSSSWIANTENNPKFVSIQKIEIRNLVARTLAEIMNLTPPEETMSDKEWTDYREKVRAAAKKELEKK